jgi:TRAP-type mannitol/chloroaromatic compound transport system permease small subunit
MGSLFLELGAAVTRTEGRSRLATPVDQAHEDMGPGLRRMIGVIDTIADWSGRAVAWLIIPMTIAVTWEVVARHFFGAPTIWAFDVTYMLYGTHFMLGTAYTLMRIGHVRTDMLYQNWSVRRQNWIDAIGYLCFFFPAMLLLFYFGWQEFFHAFQIGETSDASPWRPIVWPFKGVIPLTALLLLVQGVAELLKSIYSIRTGREWAKREMIEIG